MSSLPNVDYHRASSKSLATFVALNALSMICLLVGFSAVFSKGAVPIAMNELIAWTFVVLGMMLLTISMHSIFKAVQVRQRDDQGCASEMK